MFHRLCWPPSIPLSFNLAAVLLRWDTYRVSCGTDALMAPTPSVHRLQLGLPGYLILFAPLAFAPQRQKWTSEPPSPLVFLPISTDVTLTPGIPFASSTLKSGSPPPHSLVERENFRQGLPDRLRALYTQ